MAQATLKRVLDDIETLDTEELQKVDQAIRARLPQQPGETTFTPPTPERIESANALLRNTVVTLGHATGADNESIDADLAREYGDDHSDMVRSRGKM